MCIFKQDYEHVWASLIYPRKWNTLISLSMEIYNHGIIFSIAVVALIATSDVINAYGLHDVL